MRRRDAIGRAGQLDGFIDKFTPDVAALTRAWLAKAKARIPGAQILVYDNYNALAIGFGRPTRRERRSCRWR